MFKRKKKDTKTCPFCAEDIKSAATICRYCRKELPDPDAPPEEKKAGPLSGCVRPLFVGMLMLALLAIFAANMPTTKDSDLTRQQIDATASQEQRNDLDGSLPIEYLTPNPVTGLCSNGCLYVHPEEDCFIKADYDSTESPVYFLPIDSPYTAIEINIDLGERWFCSATDAEALGFVRWSE